MTSTRRGWKSSGRSIGPRSPDWSTRPWPATPKRLGSRHLRSGREERRLMSKGISEAASENQTESMSAEEAREVIDQLKGMVADKEDSGEEGISEAASENPPKRGRGRPSKWGATAKPFIRSLYLN